VDIEAVIAQPITPIYRRINWVIRTIGYSMVFITLIYLINNYLIVWREWPGVVQYFLNQSEATQNQGLLAWLQLLSYFAVVPIALYRMVTTPAHRMIDDSQRLSDWSAYLIRVAFWSVVLIGLFDGLLSWMRVEDLLLPVFGQELASNLGKSIFRGSYVHYPLILVSMLMAYRIKTVSMSWLALLVVFAELWIVVARFIFSYEQTLMGDLVRFWYAGLFLFASAYTLKEEGHVRVDVIFAGKSVQYKAWVNSVGVVVLGLPLCWVILTLGMWDSTSIINSPLASFEISQSGYGLFIKYLMAGFLVVFAVSMILQFCSYLLKNVAILVGEVEVIQDQHDDVMA
jgi:TRAP-type mannitol/chloroaromatic compound transport system permease small subunit